jgi:hypothetical protein
VLAAAGAFATVAGAVCGLVVVACPHVAAVPLGLDVVEGVAHGVGRGQVVVDGAAAQPAGEALASELVAHALGGAAVELLVGHGYLRFAPFLAILERPAKVTPALLMRAALVLERPRRRRAL